MEHCLSHADLLRFSNDDMRFVFIYNSLVGPHASPTEKSLDDWITRLKSTFDDVAVVKKQKYDLLKCAFSHKTLSFCILEIDKSHQTHRLNFFEFHS